jgi:preprotein translocase subunit SecB
MKPKPSPLQILDFALTELEFKMIPPENEQVDIVQSFKDYELDIDFGLSNDDFLKVYIKAEVNRDEKLPGYSMMVEAACIFQFDAGDLEEGIQRQLEGFSTIYIALNSLRGLISNFTSNAPFGRYILPSIDLNDLIEKKKQAGNASKKKTQTVKTQSKRNVSKTKK